MQRIRCRFRKVRLAASVRRGFTLMELLLVLAILGVIMGLVIPNLIGRQKEAQIRAAKVQVLSINSACDMYASDHGGEYPETLDALISNPGNDENWKGPYFQNSPTIPADQWGNQIQYMKIGQNQPPGTDRPDIWSMGPDRQSNTQDDIGNWSKSST